MMARRRWGVCAGGLYLLLSACTGSRSADPVAPSTSSTPLRMAPTSPEEIGVTLDPDGRPYDVQFVGDRTVEARFETDLHVVDGQLRIMDGNAVEVDPTFFEATPVDLDVEDVAVTVLWEQAVFEGDAYEVVLGIRLDVREATVESWSAFEFAYGTDGGVGGITSQAVVDRAAAERDPEADFFIPDLDYEEDLYVGDHDGEPGPDTIIFSNGYGDGSFPLSRGSAADGSLVSLMVWDTRYPWRRAVPDGRPPPDITRREDQLMECLDGTRHIDENGYCQSD